ncbi:MAG: mechanosensitive ion channel family protein [Planctomycetota bacterium]
MTKTTLTRLIASVLALFAASPLAGQTTLTAKDPTKVSVVELEHRLRPLTKDELVTEADAWRDALKGVAVGIAEAEIRYARSRSGSAPDGAEGLLQQLATQKEQRTAVGDRLQIVINELAGKGGEVEEYQDYLAAVSGKLSDVDVTDVSGLWTTVRGWLISDEGGLRWGLNIFWFAMTLLVFRVVSSVAGKLVDRALGQFGKTSDLLRKFFVNTVRRVVLFVGLVLALSMVEVDIGPFLAAMGAAGFVIGFALQGTLSNFASGIMILLYRPYDVGDVVELAGVAGSVKAMSLVSTTITSFDNQMVIVPNSSIWGNVITNVTGNDTRRVDMTFGIAYTDDIDQAHQLLTEIVNAHALVLGDPEPTIRLHELADSSVNFIVRPWVKTADYWAVYWDVTKSVKSRFDAAGISIPFPQHDVHVHQAATRAVAAPATRA